MQHLPRTLRLATPAIAALAALVVPAAVAAAPSGDPSTVSGYVGLAALESPKFPGAEGRRDQVLPVGAIVYRDRFFASSLDGVGMYLYQDGYWKIGTALTLDAERRHADDSPRTVDLGNIPESVRADVFATFNSRFATARVSLGQDVSGGRTGLLGRAQLAARWSPDWAPLDRLTLEAGPGATWGNARYMQTWFGVSPTQAAASGLPEREEQGGLASVDLRLGASWRVDTRWRIEGAVERTRLAHEAADSPVVEQRLGTSAQVAIIRLF